MPFAFNNFFFVDEDEIFIPSWRESGDDWRWRSSSSGIALNSGNNSDAQSLNAPLTTELASAADGNMGDDIAMQKRADERCSTLAAVNAMQQDHHYHLIRSTSALDTNSVTGDKVWLKFL